MQVFITVTVIEKISGWICCIYRFLVGKDNLTIMNVTDKDDGTYTCIVNTTLDSVSASAVLTVVGKNTLKLLLLSMKTALDLKWKAQT